MAKVEILRLGPTIDREPVGAVGEVVEISDDLATAMVKFAYAKRVTEDAPADETPDASGDDDAVTADDDDDDDDKAKPAKK